MTNEQFDVLISHLEGIKASIESLKGKPGAKHQYDLSDVWSEVNDVVSAVGSVESAVGNIKLG